VDILTGLGSFFGTLFGPIGTIFHYVFFEPVFNILILIYHGVGSFALAIILLTLLIRGALFPLTRRQLASTRKMQELQPKLKQIQAQHRGDAQAAMAAQQALYKEHGVSMYGGCLPLLIQMPFLYSLFYAFEALLSTKSDALKTINGYIYPFLPQLSHLPDQHFFWTNLGSPDPLFILPVIAAILTFIQMRMAMPVRRPGAPSDPTTQTTQMMQWMMPLFTLFLGTRFPSGLALYWTVSTGFSAVQQYLLSGWGSLFVGVPGMERFVPAPKEIATIAPTAVRGSLAAGRAAATAEPTQPERPQGFLASIREMMQQAREQAEAQARVTQDQQAGRARVVEAGEGSGVVEEEPGESKPAAPAQPGPRDKRPRAAKGGPVLVRPPAAIESASDLESSTARDLPEERIARDMAASENGIIAETGASLNGDEAKPKGAEQGAPRTNGAAKPNVAALAVGGAGGAPKPRPGGANQPGSQKKGQQPKRKGHKGSR